MQQKDIQSTYKSNDTEGLYGLGMNIGAICLLAWANFYDSADGQLARMTGQKTQLGRILDGAASEVWFIPIYIALVYRFYIHHALEFQWLGIADTPTNAAIATGSAPAVRALLRLCLPQRAVWFGGLLSSDPPLLPEG